MRRIAMLVIALGAACAASRPEPAPPKTPVAAPVRTPPPVDPEVVEGSTFAENEPVFSPPVEPPLDTKARAQQLFREGTMAFSRNDFGAAIAAFTEAHRLVPMAPLMFNIAMVREKMGDLGGARNDYAAVLVRADADENLRVHVREAIQRIDRILAGAPPSRSDF